MSIVACGGIGNHGEIAMEHPVAVPVIQSAGKTVKKGGKLSANLQWDKELDIIIIKVLRGEKLLFQVPPDVIIKMAKYLRDNLLKGMLVNRTV